MVRVSPENYGILREVGLPGEPSAHTYLRCARMCVMPPTIIVRYRKAPLFPQWLTMGPLSPESADFRGTMLASKGWEVEVSEVKGAMPGPAWPDDETTDDEDNDNE